MFFVVRGRVMERSRVCARVASDVPGDVKPTGDRTHHKSIHDNLENKPGSFTFNLPT